MSRLIGGIRAMVNWLKANIFTLLAIGILSCFAGVWIHIMRRVAEFEPTTDSPTLELATGIVTLAGLLGTTIATVTASALGFTVSEVRTTFRATGSTYKASDVGAALSIPTLLAILVYVGVSVAVFFTWIANEAIAPEVLSVYALSSIGWLVGSASVAFKSEQT